MAKPREDEGQNTRELLLQAAAKAFSEYGYGGANIRQIARDAGVGFQLIQYYFGSKQALLEEVVEYLFKQDAEAGYRHLEAIAPLPPEQQLVAQVHSVVRYKWEHPELNQILFREAMQDSPEYQLIHDKAVEGFRELSSTFLEKMQKEGVVKTGIALEDLVYLFQGAVLYRILSRADDSSGKGKKADKDKLIKQHAEAIIELLKK